MAVTEITTVLLMEIAITIGSTLLEACGQPVFRSRDGEADTETDVVLMNVVDVCTQLLV